MASKDSKTSKTARVMNLLSKKPDTAAPEDSPESAAAEPSAASAPVPPVITSMAPDAAAADQIKSALELAFEEELDQLAASAPQEEAEAAPAPVSAPPETAEPPAEEVPPAEAQVPPEEPEPAQDAVPEAVTEPEAPEVPVEAPIQKAEEEEPLSMELPIETEHHWKLPDSPTTPGYINVMQVLVEEKAPKYIKLFGLCQCARCLEDVKALTLNNLPPKYVVLEQGDMIPRLTIYEGKYSSDITAQMLHACRLVMDRPHHSR